jgi:hypothetical protein
MPEPLPYLVHHMLFLYALFGVLVALLFLLFALDRFDPSAAGAYAFRPLLVPGLVLLWPVVVIRWIRFERSRR